MRLAVFADIHANRQAFSACLDFARAHGAERIVCLGDIVGYGADPEWAVPLIRPGPPREMNPSSCRTSPDLAYGIADAHPIVLLWV